MTTRPPLDPLTDYTIMNASAARKQLASGFGVTRAKTADMTLDELQSALTERLPAGFGEKVVVITDASAKRLMKELDTAVLAIVGATVDPNTPLMSRMNAETMLRQTTPDVPDGEPAERLEDAIAGLRGVRPKILENDEFDAYRAAAHKTLAQMPSGRPATRTLEEVA